MQTRRDQLHAYRFLTRRALASLVTGEPNVVEPPMRRLTLTTVSGIMIAVLIAAVYTLFGVIKPSTGNTWKAAGTIIVERETGARYVLIDNVLHPVLNYSSAVLALSGQQSTHVTLVSQSDLSSTKRGATIGIDGIPDSLPSASNLLRSNWTVCSRQLAGNAGALDAQVTVQVGHAPAASAVPAGGAVLVRAPSAASTYLLWHGERLGIASQEVATALGLQSVAALTVGTAFLDSLPQGSTLRTPTVPGLGQPVATIAGQRSVVGQLIKVSDNGQLFVVLRDGIAPVNALQADLLQTLTLGRNRHLPQLSTTADVELGIAQSKSDVGALIAQFGGLPTAVPTVEPKAAQNGGLCAGFGTGGAPAILTVPASTLPATPGTTVEESVQSQRGIADQVQLRPGQAALVRSADGSPTVFVVAEPGKKYPAASVQVLSGFGYGNSNPLTLPGQLLSLIPTGPALDPDAARRPVTQ
ncbi:MAG: type VII secretion protein EccB [Jatrophihabitantaceae bacterium]